MRQGGRGTQYESLPRSISSYRYIYVLEIERDNVVRVKVGICTCLTWMQANHTLQEQEEARVYLFACVRMFL